MFAVVDTRDITPDVYLFATLEDACRGYHVLMHGNIPFVINDEWWNRYQENLYVWVVPVQDRRKAFHSA